MFRLLLALLALCAPSLAVAQTWRHQPSGVSVAALPEGMQVGRETDNRQDGSDVIVQFGSDSEPVTLYVYRSAYPGAALWFERTRLAMRTHVGAPTEAVAPRSFTLGAATAPNGLREDIDLPAGGSWRATSVAIAQYGAWMVKLRITSRTQGAAALARRMDAVLAALRFPAAAPPAHPLTVPGPCGDTVRMNGRARARSGEDSTMAAIMLIGAHAQARGGQGLVADPSAWCRAGSSLPGQVVSLYRRRDGRGWVALLGDSGLAVAALALDEKAMTFAATPSATIFAQMFDGMPEPDPAIESAIPYLVGRAQGTASVDAATGTQVSVSLPES